MHFDDLYTAAAGSGLLIDAVEAGSGSPCAEAGALDRLVIVRSYTMRFPVVFRRAGGLASPPAVW